ncbi:hydroxyisourate hydrolase [Sphingomonas sp. BK580]|uniref:hydroxyisourate hydrolase n=1 Tax=Sphingomonas sp. BK580 TaxID=2586972 RepID=UPI00160E16AB|nr:hydroxyisourate hydrolase [Sphingomonas sp. BK580]MBB3691762.1 5-hydroxyisourate hydrolase [Sphingomonas sp. BK580]
MFPVRHLGSLGVVVAASLAVAATPAHAAEISTHVLDLTRGSGGKGVPVSLERRSSAGRWERIGEARTDADGRVRRIGDPATIGAGIYRLTFDMTRYPDAAAKPFFPEIVLTFSVTDAAAHYHVPVAVSPYGYSTYRGS